MHFMFIDRMKTEKSFQARIIETFNTTGYISMLQYLLLVGRAHACCLAPKGKCNFTAVVFPLQINVKNDASSLNDSLIEPLHIRHVWALFVALTLIDDVVKAAEFPACCHNKIFVNRIDFDCYYCIYLYILYEQQTIIFWFFADCRCVMMSPTWPNERTRRTVDVKFIIYLFELLSIKRVARLRTELLSHCSLFGIVIDEALNFAFAPSRKL